MPVLLDLLLDESDDQEDLDEVELMLSFEHYSDDTPTVSDTCSSSELADTDTDDTVVADASPCAPKQSPGGEKFSRHAARVLHMSDRHVTVLVTEFGLHAAIAWKDVATTVSLTRDIPLVWRGKLTLMHCLQRCEFVSQGGVKITWEYPWVEESLTICPDDIINVSSILLIFRSDPVLIYPQTKVIVSSGKGQERQVKTISRI